MTEELADPRDTVDTVGQMVAIVRSVIQEVLTEAEHRTLELQVFREEAGVAGSSRVIADSLDHLDKSTLVEYEVCGSWGGTWMQGNEARGKLKARFRSEFVDFVATSSFGWGQQRS